MKHKFTHLFFCRRGVFVAILLFSAHAFARSVDSLRPVVNTSLSVAQKDSIPSVQFLHSPLGDYLYFLFNRKEYKLIPKMDSLIGTQKIPTLGALIALPEIVASAQISGYKDIYPLLEQYYMNTNASLIEGPYPKRLSYSDNYPNYDTILSIVRQGEAFYPAFLKQWKQHVEPSEVQQIAQWRQQLSELRVLENFYKITKLHFRTSRLEIVAMAYHLAGSANYSPAGIYTSLFKKPNLPWVVGHEGTHLLLSGPVSSNWMKTARAKQLGELAVQKGESLYEIEENACHFLQAMLSKTCGTEADSYVIHAPYPKGFRKEMLARMEQRWNDYLQGSDDFITFMMNCAEDVLRLMQDSTVLSSVH